MTHENNSPGGNTPDSNQPQTAQPQPGPKPFVYPDGPAEAAAAGIPTAEVDALRAEVAELKDRVLRTHAEMDNMRKRLEKEKSDASKYAISKFARDIVGIGDVFQRAIAAAPGGDADATPGLKAFVEGVTMTERELINVLERHGIKRIDPKGQPFNPHQHQAVMEQPNPDVPSGTVTQVFQPGYTIEDRILRPAMVVVSTGGAKTAPKPVDGQAAPVPPVAANDAAPGGEGTSNGAGGGQG